MSPKKSAVLLILTISMISLGTSEITDYNEVPIDSTDDQDGVQATNKYMAVPWDNKLQLYDIETNNLAKSITFSNWQFEKYGQNGRQWVKKDKIPYGVAITNEYLKIINTETESIDSYSEGEFFSLSGMDWINETAHVSVYGTNELRVIHNGNKIYNGSYGNTGNVYVGANSNGAFAILDGATLTLYDSDFNQVWQNETISAQGIDYINGKIYFLQQDQITYLDVDSKTYSPTLITGSGANGWAYNIDNNVYYSINSTHDLNQYKIDIDGGTTELIGSYKTPYDSVVNKGHQLSMSDNGKILATQYYGGTSETYAYWTATLPSTDITNVEPDGINTFDQNINLTADISTNQDVYFEIKLFPPSGGETYNIMETNNDNTLAWWTITQAEYGTWEYDVRAKLTESGDIVANRSGTFDVKALQTPSMSIYNPANDDRLTENNINYTARVSNNGNGTVKFYLDGNEIYSDSYNPELGFYPYYKVYDTGTGPHNFKLSYIRDYDGKTFNETIDFTRYTEPIVLFDNFYPANESIINQDNAYISTEIDSNVKGTIELYVDGELIDTDSHAGDGENLYTRAFDDLNKEFTPDDYSWQIKLVNDSDRYSQNVWETGTRYFTYTDDETTVITQFNDIEPDDNIKEIQRIKDFSTTFYTNVRGTLHLVIDGDSVKNKQIKDVDVNKSQTISYDLRNVTTGVHQWNFRFTNAVTGNYVSEIRDINITNEPAKIESTDPTDGDIINISSRETGYNHKAIVSVANIGVVGTDSDGTQTTTDHIDLIINGKVEKTYNIYRPVDSKTYDVEINEDDLKETDNSFTVRYRREPYEAANITGVNITETVTYDTNIKKNIYDRITVMITLGFVPETVRIIVGLIVSIGIATSMAVAGGAYFGLVGLVFVALILSTVGILPNYIVVILSVITAGILFKLLAGD